MMDVRRLIAAVEAHIPQPDVRAALVALLGQQRTAAARRHERDRLLRLLGQFSQRRDPWNQAGAILEWCRQFERRRWPAIRTRGLQLGDLQAWPMYVGGFLLELYRLTDGDLPTSRRQIARILSVDI